ncbi:MAG: hypothetical protein CR980_01030 [Propionibacteriales bacterium]|nr:MAG: hypothetical protein CR980_01030 [Propionibacteriales bacterium]
MVTTEQAGARNVSREELDGFCDSGDMFQIRDGVFQIAWAPLDPHDYLKAEWLATEPTHLAYERPTEGPDALIVSGESACHLHKLGDLRVGKHEFTCAKPVQTERPDVNFKTRLIPNSDVTLLEGLPVTTRERTIADLLEDHRDLSLIAGVLRAAAGRGMLNTPRLIELLNPLASRYGHANGEEFLNRLLEIAALDIRNLVGRLFSLPGFQDLAVDAIIEQLSIHRFSRTTVAKLKELDERLDEAQLEQLKQTSETIKDTFKALAAHEDSTPWFVREELKALSQSATLTLEISDIAARVIHAHLRFKD